MIRIDRTQTIEDVTVYFDHERDYVFYALPDQPRFRLDDQGKPVFKFIKYRLPVDREDGKKGGGFVFFDCEFTLTPEKEKAVRQALQEQVEKRHADRGTPAPEVELGRLTATKGVAGLNLAQFAGGPIVEKAVSAGTPSMYGKNVTAFALELTPEGATVFEQALQGQGGVVQVYYDLTVPVKLPPLRGRAWWNAQKFYSFYQTIDVDWHLWDEDEYRETLREQFVSRETMGVEIDADFTLETPEATEKLVSQIRDNLTRFLESAVERNMLEAIAPVSEEGRKAPEGIEDVTRDISVNKIASVNIDLRENRAVDWRFVPQGTLPNITTLAGVKWADYAVAVDADDPFFKQLTVSIQANADFEHLPIRSVEVHLDYKEGAKHEVGEYRFTKADDVQKFQTYIENNNWQYQYWYEVNYIGAAQKFKSGPLTTDDRALTVNVDDIGIFNIEAIAGDLNFDQVNSVQVAVNYKDLVDEQFTLTKEETTHSIQKVIFQPRTEPYRYKVTYFMADGKEYRTDWAPERSGHLYINDPFGSTRTIAVRAAGNLETEIDNIFVDLKYTDETNGYVQTKSFALNKENPFVDWAFPVIGESGGKVTYSGQVTKRDGTVIPIPEAAAASTTILVGELVQDRLQVNVLSDLIDFSQVRLVKVSLRYGAGDARKDVIFKPGAAEPFAWEVALKDRSKTEYEWEATFFMADGTQREMGPITTSEPTVLPALPQA